MWKRPGHERRSAPCGIRIAYFIRFLSTFRGASSTGWSRHGATLAAGGCRQEPIRGAALRPTFGGFEPARDRGRVGEPCRAALPPGCAAGAAIDPRGCERGAAGSECSRAVGAQLVQQAHRGLRRNLAETTYLIDATGVRLNAHSAGWARFSAGVCGAKVHVIYDADADRPIYAAISAGNVNDITAAQQMPIEPGATYVFDLGYYDYALVGEARRRAMPDRHPLQIQHALGGHRGAARSEGWPHPLRPHRPSCPRAKPRAAATPSRIRCVRSGSRSRPARCCASSRNDLDAGAQEIADLYKRRWAIELFFRWVKQTLKITRFLGTSENAVRIQIAVALIAFLLLRLAQSYAEKRSKPARLRQARPRQSDASTAHRSPPTTSAKDPDPARSGRVDMMRFRSNKSRQNPCRTAVGQARP